MLWIHWNIKIIIEPRDDCICQLELWLMKFWYKISNVSKLWFVCWFRSYYLGDTQWIKALVIKEKPQSYRLVMIKIHSYMSFVDLINKLTMVDLNRAMNWFKRLVILRLAKMMTKSLGYVDLRFYATYNVVGLVLHWDHCIRVEKVVKDNGCG